MKNWLAIATMAIAVGGILMSSESCSNPESHPPTVRDLMPGGTPAKPAPNDRVNKASRLAIKRASDAAAANIPATAKKTTIAAMLSLPRPDGLAGDLSSVEFQEKRIGPFETTLWEVDATVTEIVKRSDGDFYMVIEDGKGGKSVVEVPDPALCEDSKKLKEITALRRQLDAKFHPNAEPQKLNLRARITGLGFFGYARAKEGKKPGNGARIMPGLKIDWLK